VHLRSFKLNITVSEEANMETGTASTWAGEVDFYLGNLKTLMEFWGDLQNEFKGYPQDPEARERYMEALRVAVSCVVDKTLEAREREIACDQEHEERSLEVVKGSGEK
jgi:hypothetical protein